MFAVFALVVATGISLSAEGKQEQGAAPSQMAGAFIVSMIPLAVFIFLSRYFITGLMIGYAKE